MKSPILARFLPIMQPTYVRQTFPLKSQWIGVEKMNKKATKWWPAYCGVQGKATGKAKEEKETGPHFVGQAGPYNKAIFRVPTTASHLHNVLI